MTRKIKVTGVRKHELSSSDLALIFWLQAKRILRDKRERDAKEKARKRQLEESQS